MELPYLPKNDPRGHLGSLAEPKLDRAMPTKGLKIGISTYLTRGRFL